MTVRIDRTLVVIPAYNEESALPRVLDDLRRAYPDQDILVVDDGSTDRTRQVALQRQVTVVSLPFNLGVGGALRTGFRYALRHGYATVVQVDGDGQHIPEEIPHLLKALANGADMVVGSRFASRDAQCYRISRTRRSGMRLLRLFVVALSGHWFTDTSSGFRAFNLRSIQLFASEYPVEYLGDTVEALLLATYGGLTIVEVPVAMRERAGGTPSTRHLKLLYHYVRLLAMMTVTASLRARRRRRLAP